MLRWVLPNTLYLAIELRQDGNLNDPSGDEVIVERLSGRRICSDCGAIYHIVFNPPMIGMTCYACHSTIELTNGMLKCQVCARPIAQRNDDRPQVIRKRLRIYWRQIIPVITYYRQHNLLREIDATGSFKRYFAGFLAHLARLPHNFLKLAWFVLSR